MCRIEQISFGNPKILHYMPLILNCYRKYTNYLRDDFAPEDKKFILSKIPYLWVISTQNGSFMGFVFLDNWIGNKNTNYSVELTTCFEKKAWGNFTKYAAKIFLKYCFDEFKLQKIKALIYPDNFRITNLLKNSGFNLESIMRSETLRNGKPQDIKIYALYRNYYYKNEVKYE